MLDAASVLPADEPLRPRQPWRLGKLRHRGGQGVNLASAADNGQGPASGLSIPLPSLSVPYLQLCQA